MKNEDFSVPRSGTSSNSSGSEDAPSDQTEACIEIYLCNDTLDEIEHNIPKRM